MAKFNEKKTRGKSFKQDDSKIVEPPKKDNKNSYSTTYQSPSHANRKSVKVFEETYNLVEEIKFETREKSNIDVYKKAVEYYADHVLKK